MKALTKIMTIAFGLNCMLVDIADARPRAPGGNLISQVLAWCDSNGGGFFPNGSNCFYCEFTRADGKLDVYDCCIAEDGSTACSWKLCNDVSGPNGGRFCQPAKAADLVPNIYLELLRSQVNVSKQSDLVPLPAPASMPPEGFCRRNAQGQLLVKIHNQGGSEAAATKTRVQFGSAAPTDFDTPVIAAGSSTELVVTIPNACFDANNKCAFTIGVDATAAAPESNEINNNAAGLCGPQFF